MKQAIQANCWREQRILLDGHHRKAICEQYGIDYAVRELSFDSHGDAADWIDAHQLGRRNLTPEQMSLLRGRRYNRRKGVRGGDHCSQKAKYQNDTLLDNSKKVAEELGVSTATIKRDGQFAEAVKKLDVEREVTNGTIAAPKGQIVQVAREIGENPTPEQIADAKQKLSKPHIAQNTGDNEWYTPQDYVELARKVMGSIDLDPASCEQANRIVKAKTFFSQEDDGLAQPWMGCVWMNPPYAQPYIQRFIDKLIGHIKNKDVDQAVVLVNNATETRWGQLLLRHASAVCFPSGRIRFWHPDKVSAPLQGQMIVYFGRQLEAFSKAFSNVGAICHGG